VLIECIGPGTQLAKEPRDLTKAVGSFLVVRNLWRCAGVHSEARIEDFEGTDRARLERMREELRGLAGFSGLDLDALDTLVRAVRGRANAGRVYPGRRYDGPVVLLQSDGGHVDAAAPLATQWVPLVPHLSVINVPGDHYTVVYPPNVEPLAEQLRRVLTAR
jgi:thioesterase domain-containing protein